MLALGNSFKSKITSSGVHLALILASKFVTTKVPGKRAEMNKHNMKKFDCYKSKT